MTVQNRKSARDAMVTLIDTNITDLVDTFNHAPKAPGGISPFCTVESGPADYSFNPDYNRFGLIVGIWVIRDDAEAAEDLLDDLAYALAGQVETWHNAEFVQESQPDYELLDDKYNYRVEWHFVGVDWE